MEQGIVFRKTDGLFDYCGWPTMIRAKNGVIYLVCSGHRLGHICPFGKIYLFKSEDDAKTWSGPIVATDTKYDDRDAGLLSFDDNKLMLTFNIDPIEAYTSRTDRITKYIPERYVELWKTGVERWKREPENSLTEGSYIRISDDCAKTWGEIIKVPVASPHGPIQLKNGKILFFGNRYINTLERIIDTYESEDGGKTWQYCGTVDPIHNDSSIPVHEPYAIELDDGTILGIIRVHEDPDANKFCMYKTFSNDGGKTWTTPEYLCAGAPPHVMKHSSGALVLTYTLRFGIFGQCARISYDGGKTWGDEIVLCDNAVNWDSGYCSSVELDDGSIYTVYYQKAYGDSHCSLMYTKWELPSSER